MEFLAAERLVNVRYAIRDIAVLADRLAREGREILPLNIGDPLKFDFQTPPHIVEAAVRAMRDGRNGYAPSLGTPEALAAIRADAERRHITPIQTVFVTQGVSEAVDVTLSALVNPGENILVPCPEYPLYSAVLARLGAEPNSYALDESSGWEPDLEDLERRITPRSRGIVIINPNNPTGAVYSRATLEKVVEIARRHRLLLFADEIYDRLLLDGQSHVALASLAPDLPVVTFNGLSKAFLAPGWRVGWGIVSGPAGAADGYVEGIQQLLRARLCANQPLQSAIVAALEGPDGHVVEMIGKLRARRDRLVKFCRSTPGIHCEVPGGAFYAFPRLEIEGGDEEFVRELLRRTGVLLVHGSGFGQRPGTRHVRIVFLPDEKILATAFERLARFLKEFNGVVR